MTVTNRRRYHRIPCLPSPCFIEADGRRAGCELLDESIGGFRISGIDPLMLNRDQPMLIEHRGEVVSVCCANVSRTKDGKFSIGLQRHDTRSSFFPEDNTDQSIWDVRPRNEGKPRSVSGSLINPYVRFGHSVGILCRLVSISPESVKIEVLNRKNFNVTANRVSPLTRKERRAELTDLESVDWLADIYSETQHQPIAPTVDAIIEFEFGTLGS